MWTRGVQLPWSFDPLEALRRVAADRPALLLHSGRSQLPWSRYSILAEPTGSFMYENGCSTWQGDPSSLVQNQWTHQPLRDLRCLLDDREPLWLGYLSYDLGRHIERLPSQARTDRHWPLVLMQRCAGWGVYDVSRHTWEGFGCWRDAPPPLEEATPRTGSYQASEPTSNLTRTDFERRVARALRYIHEGDVFEVNLAHRFTSAFQGDSRALFADLIRSSPAWYGAYLELPHDRLPRRSIASVSPELFLAVDTHGLVTTRPIKGTLPSTANPDQLWHSQKDIAELNMVVDMLRNDLGRVCTYGSVQVGCGRHIESHPGVHHGVATITGHLHKNRSLVDLLRATMPGGSVTGAPKVRAMQIIDELEPVRRGPYCGAIGYIHGDTAQFNIAIRTALIETDHHGVGRVDYSVGGGIVADSLPSAEYQETLDKAAPLAQVIRAAAAHLRLPEPVGM